MSRFKSSKRQVAVAFGAAFVLIGIAWGLPKIAHKHRDITIARRVDRYRNLIWYYAAENNLPVQLVRAVIRAESGGRPKVESSKHAKGLMQITDAAQKDVLRIRKLPEDDLFDPEYNIEIGTAYLRLLVNRFDGDYYLAVAAYHMGPTRVGRLRQTHPNLTSKQLLEAHANPVTLQYCRTVFSTP